MAINMSEISLMTHNWLKKGEVLCVCVCVHMEACVCVCEWGNKEERKKKL